MNKDSKSHPLLSLRALPLLVAAIATIAIVSSCGEDAKERVGNVTDHETTPTMATTNVETFISDSGYTRYHITAPVWYIFDEAKEPKWTFPDGLFLEKYDASFNPDATIKCDSATYFSEKKLWRLDGNVRMKNTAGDKFLTQQLFWNQNQHEVYSDSFIHIERSDRTIEGIGFNSNEQMTRYSVKKPMGIFPVPERKHENDSVQSSEPSDSTTNDSPQWRKKQSGISTATTSRPIAIKPSSL